MLDNQPRRFFCRHTFLAGDEQCSLRAVMVCYREYGVVPLRDRKLSDKVKRDCFERHSFVYRKYGRECGFCRSGIDFIPLTFCASLDVVRYVLSHIWPPVSSACQLIRFIDSRVTISWRVVVCLYEESLVLHFPGDHALSVLVPRPFYLLQPMCVNPWFEHLFVLLVYGVCGFHFFLGNDSSHW